MKGVVALAVGMFTLGTDSYVFSGLLADMARELHSSIAATGQIVAIFGLTYGVLSPFLTTASAGFDRRTVLGGSLTLFTLANIACALAPSLDIVMIARAAAAVGACVYGPTASTVAASLAPQRHRGRALAVTLGGLQASTIIGVPIGVEVGAQFGWRTTIALVAAIGAMAAIIVVTTVPKSPTPAPVSLTVRLAALVNRDVRTLLGIMGLTALSSIGVYTQIGSVLRATAGINGHELPGYLLAWGAAAIATNALVSWQLDRGRPASLLLTIVLAVMALAQTTLSWADKPALALLVVIVFGGAVGACQVPLQHQILGVAPDTSAALSWLSSALYFGAATGSALAGVALSVSGPCSVGPLAACAATAALVLTRIHARCNHPENTR